MQFQDERSLLRLEISVTIALVNFIKDEDAKFYEFLMSFHFLSTINLEGYLYLIRFLSVVEAFQRSTKKWSNLYSQYFLIHLKILFYYNIILSKKIKKIKETNSTKYYQIVKNLSKQYLKN